MNNPTDPPDEEYLPRTGMPTTTGGSATTSSGGRAAAAAATGTAGVQDGDPWPGQAGITASAAVAGSPDRGTRGRTPRQGTVSYQEQFQAPNPSPNRVSHEDRWNNHLAGLLKFREENGHCNVPQEYPPNPALASFVHHIRKQKDLSVERRKTLLNLGFKFDAHKAGWDEKFYEAKRILDEKRVSGEKLVVKRKDNASLYKWIGTQREEYAKMRRGKKSSMTEEEISGLERIGVDLDPSGKFAERGGGGGRKNRKKKKPTGPTSSGSSSSARAKSQSFRSHHRPGRRQMANQEGKIPASGKAARGPQKQVARKRTGKGIEIGSFEEPQQMSYASDQPSQYHSSPAQGATARQQNHAATAFPSAEIKQSGPGMRNEAAYADANAHLESSSGDVGIELRPSDSP